MGGTLQQIERHPSNGRSLMLNVQYEVETYLHGELYQIERYAEKPIDKAETEGFDTVVVAMAAIIITLMLCASFLLYGAITT